MSNTSIDFSAYDGFREKEAVLLTNAIINARRRIQRTLDSNTLNIACRYNLYSTITELNSLLRSIYDTYDLFLEEEGVDEE